MICSEFNHKILSMAPKFVVSDIAPSSFSELKANSLETLVVWSGASSNTIFGDERVNWAFRAAHDALHLKLNAPFTLEGEKLVANEQARILGGSYGDLIMLDIIAQAEYLEQHGEFPKNQLEFIMGLL